MDVVVYPSKAFGKQIERLSKARAPFVIRVPAGEKRKDILSDCLPAMLGHEGDSKRPLVDVFMGTMRIFGFYTGAACVMAEGSGYDVSYVDDGDLIITCVPEPRSGDFPYLIGSHEKALVAFRSEAADGSPHALVWLGRMHFAGEGVAVDVVEAERCYRMAAEAGSIMGLHHFATLLLRTGRTTEAIPFLKEAAAQKFPSSLYRLGRLYEAGKVVEKDDSKADALLREAASRGNLRARRRMAWRMIRGVYGLSKILPGIKAFWNYCFAYFVFSKGDPHGLQLMD